MHRVLFICLGNICRSPAAEGIFRAVVEAQGQGDDFLIDSAGLGGWHVGELPDRRMRRAGEQAGYSFTHRARQITGDDFSRFDLIIGMDRQNIQALTHLAALGTRTSSSASCRSAGSNQPAQIRIMTDFLQHHRGVAAIDDPYYGTDADFRRVVRLLEDACEGLYQEIIANAGEPPALPEINAGEPPALRQP